MVVVLWQNWGEHVGQQLPHFLAAATLTDVTISVGPASLRAHRIILAFFSPFFRRMLEEVNEERPMVVVLPGIDFAALQVIVAYMYHGQVNVPTELLPSVIDLAKMLKVKGLVELPDQVDSMIGATEITVGQNPLTNTHTEEVCLEGWEGMVELGVSAEDLATPYHSITTTTTTTTTTTQPDPHTMDKTDGIQIKVSSSNNSEGVTVSMEEHEAATHPLLLPSHQGIQLSAVSHQLTPTHIVKPTDNITTPSTTFHAITTTITTPTEPLQTATTTTTTTTTTTAATTTTTTIATKPTKDSQDDGERVPARKKRKLTKYGSSRSMEEYEAACKEKFALDNILYERLITYQQTSRHVAGLTVAERKHVWRMSSLFQWDDTDNMLYYKGHQDSRRRQVVRSLAELTTVLRLHHTNPSRGHSGWNATFDKISRTYYWRGMVQDIRDYIASCSECQLYTALKSRASSVQHRKVKKAKEMIG